MIRGLTFNFQLFYKFQFFDSFETDSRRRND